MRVHLTLTLTLGSIAKAGGAKQGALFAGLTPKKVTRKDGVTQTYHTATQKQQRAAERERAEALRRQPVAREAFAPRPRGAKPATREEFAPRPTKGGAPSAKITAGGKTITGPIPVTSENVVDEARLRDGLAFQGLISEDVRAVFLDRMDDEGDEWAIIDVDSEDTIGSITLPPGVTAPNPDEDEDEQVPSISIDVHRGSNGAIETAYTMMPSTGEKHRFTLHRGDPDSAVDEMQVQAPDGSVIGHLWYHPGGVHGSVIGSGREIAPGPDESVLHDLISEYLHYGAPGVRKASGSLEDMARGMLFAKTGAP